jgi:tRNA pseudouridine55 synthase
MARKRKGDPVHGWIVLDKPSGITSTQAVARVKRAFNAQKAGHAGTLDPLASGLLPIALGEATKVASFAMDGVKVYRFTVRWGAATDTDDSEGTVAETSDARPDGADIAALLPGYTGVISQTPPQFSAIKIAGERAYDLARQGENVALEARDVEIARLELVATCDEDHAEFEAECSKGTYVRSLARDFGRDLGCLGHISELRRTRVGPFGEDDMISLEKLEGLSHIAAGSEPMKDFLRPVETALDDIPALAISRAEATRMRQGQPVIMRGRDAPILCGTVYVSSHGNPVALAEAKQGALHPKRVFTLAD